MAFFGRDCIYISIIVLLLIYYFVSNPNVFTTTFSQQPLSSSKKHSSSSFFSRTSSEKGENSCIKTEPAVPTAPTLGAKRIPIPPSSCGKSGQTNISFGDSSSSSFTVKDGCHLVQDFFKCMDGKLKPPTPLFPLAKFLSPEQLLYRNCSSQQPGSNPKKISHFSTISAQNADQILKTIATVRKEIVFTTFTHHAKQVSQWSYYLQRVGMLSHALLIAEEAQDCAQVNDLCQPTPICVVHMEPWLKSDVQRGNNQALSVHHKWYWAHSFVSRGYNALFLDDDAYPLVNLFDSWDHSSWDCQGLSDLRYPGLFPFSVGDFSDCHRLIYDGIGQCQSTGVMFMRAHPSVADVLWRMVYDIQYLPQEWEQAKWQKYTSAPRNWRYRLLPKKDFGNMDDFLYLLSVKHNKNNNDEKQLPLHLHPKLIHFGYYFYESKAKASRCFGLVIE